LPHELQGQWQTILTYVPGYYTGIVPVQDFIGSIGVTFRFSPEGRYDFALNSAATYFNGLCFRTTRWTEYGTASIAGSELTLTPVHATHSVMDSCGESVFLDPAPTSIATLTATTEVNETGGLMLRLVFPSGENLLLEK
jgi:hypothetical protein